MPRSLPTNSSIGKSFVVSIVEPEHGINLGYLARTAANFGITRLLVVSKRPMDAENLAQAKLFASHGRWLIDKIEYLESFQSLREKFELLIGTTAIGATRKSNLTRRTMTAEACATKFATRKKTGKIENCFVFGRDSTGLTNVELKKCDYCVTIRTGSEYNTLNVSHAAAILFYEFTKQFSKKSLETKNKFPRRVSGQNQPAARRERERAILLFQELGKDAEFKSFKTGLLQESLKRLFGRSDPTMRELYILMGLASKASNKIRRLSKASA
ncbi:MAG: hypothetical protein OK457_01100 [Thaumarchaeota archaeon]|nr:hypothetical protein [Nitrososphaerota archaeon]